jgi:hypothetical protein
VFFFNGETHPLLDMQSASLLPATPDSRAKVVKWIKTLKPDDDTALGDALERALKLQPQVIYFVTDGEIPPTTPTSQEIEPQSQDRDPHDRHRQPRGSGSAPGYRPG